MVKKIFITPGDKNGVGLEVTLKALSKLKEKNESYIFFSTQKLIQDHLEKLNIDLNFKIVTDISDVNDTGVFCYTGLDTPLEWFEYAVSHCSQNSKDSALVTGPLSKKEFNDKKVLGHTSYLEQKFSDHSIFMCFFGELYNCLLLTDHTPLKDVADKVTVKRLNDSLTLLNVIKPLLQLTKPIAVLGLNPHSGENGLIGTEELNVHVEVLKKFKDVEGPLPGDHFFSKETYKKYSFVVANYHDQGLAPFKVLNGFNATQASLGLPFVRTSVCHGTASELYLKNQADSKSMTESIQLAKKLLALHQ